MNLSEKILVLILCIIFVGELLLVSFTISVSNKPTVIITGHVFSENEDTLRSEVDFSVSQPTYPLIIRVALIPLYDIRNDKPVYIYYDENYPSSYVTRAAWMGFIDHLLPSLKLKGNGGIVEVVSANRLKDVMSSPIESVVIIPSGVFPETVHSKNVTLVDNYLRNGGTIIWMGDGFAYYSGKFRKELTWPSEENPGWASQEAILGYSLSGNYFPITASESSPIATALNLQYPGIERGVTISQALANGGLVLGKVYEDKTSIASVPVGKGYLIIFGGAVGITRSEFGEDIVANDVANILLSNIYKSNGEISFVTVSRENVASNTIEINVSKEGLKGMLFVAFSIDDYSYFFQKVNIPIE